MADERRSSRRDFFRLFGGPLADAVKGARREGPPPPPAGPPVRAPLEDGRLVVDLSVHPLVPGAARAVVHRNWPEPVLLVRVTADHYACVTAHCPHCFRAMRWDREAETVSCPRGAADFRLDGLPARGRRDLRLRVYTCSLAGPRLEIGLLAPPEE